MADGDDDWDEHNGLYFDRRGQPITLRQWSKRFEDAAYKIVDRTEFPDGRMVSTVWLGIDHGWFSDGPPIIFETMVFGPEPSTKVTFPSGETANFYPDEHCERYATEEEARAGHERICAALRQTRVTLDLALIESIEKDDSGDDEHTPPDSGQDRRQSESGEKDKDVG